MSEGEIEVDVWTPERFAKLIFDAVEAHYNNPEGYALIRHVSIEEAKKMYPDKRVEPSHVLDSERQSGE